jgi:hypothetical protein
VGELPAWLMAFPGRQSACAPLSWGRSVNTLAARLIK